MDQICCDTATHVPPVCSTGPLAADPRTVSMFRGEGDGRTLLAVVLYQHVQHLVRRAAISYSGQQTSQLQHIETPFLGVDNDEVALMPIFAPWVQK